jgi:hypothetical protein
MCAPTHIEAISKMLPILQQSPNDFGIKDLRREDRTIFGRIGGSKVDNIILPLCVRCG